MKAEKNPDCRTEKAEKKGFSDENKDNGVLGNPERAQKANFGSATNYIGGDGVGDEKHADDESDEREGCKVKLKCAEHFSTSWPRRSGNRLGRGRGDGV